MDIAHGILQLGGHFKLVALGGRRSIRRVVVGILSKLRATLAVLHGNGVAPVVELQDLDIAVYIGDGGLVMIVLEGQLAAEIGNAAVQLHFIRQLR